MFAYDKHEDDSGTTLRFELRDDGDINVDEVAASTMWSILLPVLLEFEELLQSYSGMLLLFPFFSTLSTQSTNHDCSRRQS